jgi:phage terminase large subunit-like protein
MHSICRTQLQKKEPFLKREWWQSWKGQVPSLKHVIQSYDTAFSKKESADYSAITTWGVFEPTPGDIV